MNALLTIKMTLIVKEENDSLCWTGDIFLSDVLFYVIKRIQIEKQHVCLYVCVFVYEKDRLELQAEPVSTEQFSPLAHSYRQMLFARSLNEKRQAIRFSYQTRYLSEFETLPALQFDLVCSTLEQMFSNTWQTISWRCYSQLIHKLVLKYSNKIM